MNATISDLRYRMKDILRAIDRGETVSILYRGKKKVLLTRVPDVAGASDRSMPTLSDLPFFGLWKDRDDLADPASYVRSLRRPRPSLAPESERKRPGKKLV